MILYVSATQGEAAQVPSDYPLIVTGIGTIRATLALTEYLAHADKLPERIINFGTAGSLSGNTGIFEIDHVFQHDFDHKVIEQIIGKPFPNGIDLPTVSTLPTARLATGDSFVNDPDTRARLAQQAQLCDMEGYAIAFVAQHFGIPCTLIKQVSDNADDAAPIPGWMRSIAAPTISQARSERLIKRSTAYDREWATISSHSTTFFRSRPSAEPRLRSWASSLCHPSQVV